MAAAETQTGTSRGEARFQFGRCKHLPGRESENTVIGIKFLRQKMFFGDTDADFAKPDRIALLILVQLANSCSRSV